MYFIFEQFYYLEDLVEDKAEGDFQKLVQKIIHSEQTVRTAEKSKIPNPESNRKNIYI